MRSFPGNPSNLPTKLYQVWGRRFEQNPPIIRNSWNPTRTQFFLGNDLSCLKSLMAMPSKAYRWSQPAKTLAVWGDDSKPPQWFMVYRFGRLPPNWGQQNTCCGFLSPPPKKKHLSWFRKNGRGCNNKNKAICFRLFFVFQVDGCVSHLCETPACHGPEHGLEQFSERQEHLGRDGNGRVVRVSAFRSFVFQITGGVEDAHVVH